jgi:hypothetical protein
LAIRQSVAAPIDAADCWYWEWYNQGSMGIALTFERDVLPVLAAYQTSRLWGHVTIAFEDGRIVNLDVFEKMRWSEQVKAWLRRLLRRPTA